MQPIELNDRELASVLGGLRLLQHYQPHWLEDIRTNCNEFEPLTAQEIDALCERINEPIDENQRWTINP